MQKSKTRHFVPVSVTMVLGSVAMVTMLLQDTVRSQDSWVLMFSASNSCRKSQEIVWKYLQDKWGDLKERFQGQFLLARIIDVSAVSANRVLLPRVSPIHLVFSSSIISLISFLSPSS